MSTVLLPGEIIYPNISNSKHNIYVGNGLIQSNNDVITTIVGKPFSEDKQTFFIDSSQKMYFPSVDDEIVGIVMDRRPGDNDEGYIVDINSFQTAFLPVTSFEGATRKNKNPLKSGTAIFGRVIKADKHLEPVLSCVNGEGKADLYGVLDLEGNVFKCSTGLSKSLLHNSTLLPSSSSSSTASSSSSSTASSSSSSTASSSSNSSFSILRCIGRYLPLEYASGENGHVYLRTASPRTTLAVYDLIQYVYGMSAEEAEMEIKGVLYKGKEKKKEIGGEKQRGGKGKKNSQASQSKRCGNVNASGNFHYQGKNKKG